MGVAAQNATKEDAQRPNKMLSVSFSLKNQFLNHTTQPQEHLLLGLSSFHFIVPINHAATSSSVSLQLHNLRCHIVTERLIMLHKQDGGLVLLQHRLDLHSGDDVDVVHWLVPDVKVHGFADGTGEEDLFLLACA